MFEGLSDEDIKQNPEGPFNNTTRSLLVDSILRNLAFLSEKQRLKIKLENTLNNIMNQNSNQNSEAFVEDLRINSILKTLDTMNSYRGIFK